MIKKLLIILFSSLIFFYFIFQDINIPYVGPNATNFNVYSLIAHNFNKFGYIQTKLAPLISVSETYPKDPQYFFHHPTFLSFSESILFKLFGESFWVGRLSVILYSLGSFFLIYLISKKIFNERLALTCLLIGSLIPAATIWGKMIGHEPLVLFFVLLTLYLIILYFDTNKKRYFYFSILFNIFGILSDWPALIFSFTIFLLFLYKRKVKEGILLCAISILTTVALLVYIYFLRNGLWDLQNAVFLRSFSGLIHIPYWPLTWIAAWITRVFIYFNPLIVILSIAFLYTSYKLYISKKLSSNEIIILCLFIFPIFHQLLYAQAVYSHNYLLYYHLPFYVFSSSYILNKFLKKGYLFLFLAIIVFSFIYLLIISDYKSKQIKSNLWRYEFAQKISEFIIPYETVVLNNRDRAVEPDLLWYPFLLNWIVSDTKSSDYYSKNYKYYVFTCNKLCPSNIKLLNDFKNKNKYVHIRTNQAEGYIIFLKEREIGNIQNGTEVFLKTSNSELLENTFAKQINNYIKNIIKIPQI